MSSRLHTCTWIHVYLTYSMNTQTLYIHIYFLLVVFLFIIELSYQVVKVVKVPHIFWIQNHLSGIFPANILSQFMVWLVFLTTMFKEQRFLIFMKSTFKYFIFCTLCILSKKIFALSKLTRSPVFFYKSCSFAFW